MAVDQRDVVTVTVDGERRIRLQPDEDGYRKAQELLNAADVGTCELGDDDRDKLNSLIRAFQTSQFRI